MLLKSNIPRERIMMSRMISPTPAKRDDDKPIFSETINLQRAPRCKHDFLFSFRSDKKYNTASLTSSRTLSTSALSIAIAAVMYITPRNDPARAAARFWSAIIRPRT